MTALLQKPLFPIDAAPARVRQHGLREAHSRPLVSRGKYTARPYSSFRTTPTKAWKYPELEYPRSGNAFVTLLLDIDNPNSLEFLAGLLHDGKIPLWNWLVLNERNGHCQPNYCLAKPVHRGEHARRGPLQFLGRIAEYLTATTGADGGYSGVLAHNPMQRAQKGMHYRTSWGRRPPYTLQELAEPIPHRWRRPQRPQSVVGRNVALFEVGLLWAGRKCNAALPVLPMLEGLNTEFPNPLAAAEVRGIAKSVERYRQRWAAQGWHSARFIDKQRARGRASGKARRESTQKRDETILALLKQGHSMRAVASQFGLSARAVHYVAHQRTLPMGESVT